MGIDAVGVHVESFDPEVLRRVAPGKFRTGIDAYFRTWERAVALFGEGRVSTYVILGMGEDPGLTVEMCRRAIDIGVYPFVVPFRPVAGSLMEAVPAPAREYTEPIYRKVAAYLAERGLDATTAVAGCARCQACSSLNLVQQAGFRPPCGPSGMSSGAPLLQIGKRPA
jgi:biotin synthase-related radical SAM superfamily protein